MNKVERLAGIVLVLSRGNKVLAKDLAALFEVSERTIYRDVQALSELQVPIVAETGNTGGYSLPKQYAVKPILFSEEECQAIHLGLNFIRSQKGFPFAKPADRALEKLTALFAAGNIRAATEILQKIHYHLPVTEASRELALLLGQIREAIAARRTVEIEYQSLNSREKTSRKVDIYHLIFETDAWHIIGYCHLRRDFRQFKLCRISSLTILDETFAIREHQEPPAAAPPEPIVVRVRNNTILSRRINENLGYRNLICSRAPEYLELIFLQEFLTNDYLIELVSGFGKDAAIIGPPWLREKFQKVLTEMLYNYQDDNGI